MCKHIVNHLYLNKKNLKIKEFENVTLAIIMGHLLITC